MNDTLAQGERIKSIQKGYWIQYDHATSILEKLDYFRDYESVDRMPNLLIVGETNSGKTALIKRYLRNNPAYTEKSGNGLKVPVLYIIAPADASEKRFYNTILEKLQIPTTPQIEISRREQQIINVLSELGTRLLIIDEFQHLYTGSSPRKQRLLLNVIKNLGSLLRISIVAAGTPEARNALLADSQLANRFTPVSMKKWKFDKDYIRLIKSFEMLLPLKEKSNLHLPALSQKILSMSEGTIGEIYSIVRDAAIYAIKHGQEKITTDVLDKIEYMSPNQRIRM